MEMITKTYYKYICKVCGKQKQSSIEKRARGGSVA